MSASFIFAFVLALVAAALAVAMAFAPATNMEMTGFCLFAAFTSGLAVLAYAEETRPQPVRAF